MSHQSITPLFFFSQNAYIKQELVRQFVGKKISELRTPSLVIDKTVLERNCYQLGDISSKLNKQIRVHVKTHKTVEGTRIQLEGAKTSSIVVSTLPEAYGLIDSELVESGLLKDVLLGFPITPDKFNDIYLLSQKVERFEIFIDNIDTLKALESYSKGQNINTPFRVLLKVDCGYGRAGVPINNPESLELARMLQESSCVEFIGIYTHAGHSYSSQNSEEALEYLKNECDAARQFRKYFIENGIDIKSISIGATPTVKAIMEFMDKTDMNDILLNIDEVHAGAFAFLDRQQVATGLGSYKDVSISVVCRVSSIYKDRDSVLIDGGALAFSKDTAPQGGFGYAVDSLVNKDDKEEPKIIANLKKISQEHGILEYSSLDVDFKIGQVVRIIPNHCCLAAASHFYYLIVENGSDVVRDIWIPIKGW